MQNKKVGAGHLGLGDNIFSTICRTFFPGNTRCAVQFGSLVIWLQIFQVLRCQGESQNTWLLDCHRKRLGWRLNC